MLGATPIKVFLCAAGLLFCPPAMAQEAAQEPAHEPDDVIVDLADHSIEIDLGFKGSNLLVFGVTGDGDDIIVVLRGPDRRETVRRKERIGGIWINGSSMTFRDVPSFYAVAATRPILDMGIDADFLDYYQIGNDRMGFAPVRPDPGLAVSEFSDALVDHRVAQGLFTQDPIPVKLISGRLFRTAIDLPSNVSTGTFSVRVYEVKDGKIIGRRQTPLSIKKVGLEARIYHFSREEAFLYGIFAVLVALIFGWLVSVLFRKG